MLFDYSNAAQTRFVRLSDYCLAEFIMEPISSSIFTTQQYYRLNNEFNQTKQIYNIDSALRLTGNVKDLTVTSVNDNIVAYLDSEIVPNYTDYDANLTETVLTSYPVVTDTIKLHFLTGFDFEDFEALIFSVRSMMNSGEQCILANILLSPETFSDILKFNPRPIYLGEGVYDRFVILKIPSVRNINDDYYTAANKSLTFGYKITDGVGLVNYDPISLILGEADQEKMIHATNGIVYQGYQINQIYTASVSQVNELAGFGVHIAESIAGDYIEYFGMWNGGFPEEMVALLNRKGPENDWILIHQLSVYEQVGTAFIRSSHVSIYQEDAYDEPLLYRPILKYAHEAISASIDYTLRLFNRANGDQEIRTGSMTIVNPNKYGKKLNKIQLANKPMSNAIFNKIVSKSFDSTILFIDSNPNTPPVAQAQLISPTTTETITKTEYVPMFYTFNNITVAEKNQKISLIDQNEVIVFGQGKLPIIITPFDNVIKLKVSTKNGTALVPFNLNLNSKLKLVFNSRQNRISFDNLNDQTKENLGEGEVVFRLSKDESLKILSSSDRIFYLTIISADGTETSIYAGQWYTEEERDTVNQIYVDAIAALNSANKVDEKIAEIVKKSDDAAQIQTPTSDATPQADVITIPGYVDPVTPAQTLSPIKQKIPQALLDKAKKKGLFSGGAVARKMVEKLRAEGYEE